jgi:hypothetical protein
MKCRRRRSGFELVAAPIVARGGNGGTGHEENLNYLGSFRT